MGIRHRVNEAPTEAMDALWWHKEVYILEEQGMLFQGAPLSGHRSFLTWGFDIPTSRLHSVGGREEGQD